MVCESSPVFGRKSVLKPKICPRGSAGLLLAIWGARRAGGLEGAAPWHRAYLLPAVVVRESAVRQEENDSARNRKCTPFSLGFVLHLSPCGAVEHDAPVEFRERRPRSAADGHRAALLSDVAPIEHRVVGAAGGQTAERFGALREGKVGALAGLVLCNIGCVRRRCEPTAVVRAYF